MNRIFTLCIMAVLTAVFAVNCLAQQVSGTYYFPDKPFPQYMKLWQEGWSFTDDDGSRLVYAKPDMPLGGYIFVYYKNDTSKPMTITDISINGIRMSEALGKSKVPDSPDDKVWSSIMLSKLPKAQIEQLNNLGWPAWWKPEPATVEPGGYGEVIIRMKRDAKTDQLKIGLVSDVSKSVTNVYLRKSQPRFTTIAFNPDLNVVSLYVRSAKTGNKPVKVLIDDKDVTASSVISSDKSLDMSSVVVNLSQPLKWMSYHNYKVVFEDGSSATYGIRSWGHEMVYGVWSSPAEISDPETALKSFIDDYAKHNVNCVMPYVVGAERKYFDTDAGWKYCEEKGVGRMIHWPEEGHDATFIFAMDEPDAHDANPQATIAPKHRLGMLGQCLTDWTRILRKAGPNSPILLNIDNTYKPENWYTYHQMADIPCVDPYYTENQDFEDFMEPYHYSAHTKPTYVQGVATISQSSGQPKPLHVILLSCQYSRSDKSFGRYPTPEEKRMEVYYSIGAGAKGLSYWMFASDNETHGMGYNSPGAKALWKEVGLLGAEVRTASPVITTSSPIDLSIETNNYLWVKALLSGKDTLALVTVNDNVACDRLGTVVKPADNAKVSVKLPSWINPKDVFEVTSDGIKDLSWERGKEKMSINMGTVNVSKFVIITANSALKGQLEKRYKDMFAANVEKIKAE